VSPVQRNDDDGRQIRQPWLGAKGARWPMDWTYDEWALGLFGFIVGGTLITWVVPAAVMAFIVIRSAARFISIRNNPHAPRKTYLSVVAMMTTLCLILSIDPMFWIKPIFFPFAIVASLFMPSRTVKAYGKYVGWNRPLAYWVLMPFRIARGPRLVATDKINPAALGMGLDLDSLDRDDTADLTPGRIVIIKRPTYKVKRPASQPTPRAPKPVKAKITSAPKPTRHGRIAKRQGIPGMKPAKKIYRTSTGLVVFGTEIRIGE
jgi:hypothetical protein